MRRLLRFAGVDAFMEAAAAAKATRSSSLSETTSLVTGRTGAFLVDLVSCPSRLLLLIMVDDAARPERRVVVDISASQLCIQDEQQAASSRRRVALRELCRAEI